MNIFAGKTTYIIFSSILGIPFLIFLLVILFKGPIASAVHVLFFLSFCELFVFFYVSRFNIKIDNERIHYRSLFSGVTYIDLSDICSVTYKVGSVKYSERFLPFYRLEIKGGGKVIMINLKVFDRKDIKLLNDFLGRMLKNCG